MWKRAVFLVLFIVLMGVAFIFMPQGQRLDHLLDSGAGYDVRILRDTWGVPHVFGKTDADVAYGLAYAHAEDDFLTIQQGLIAARGRLASVYGADAAPNDYMVQLLRIWDLIEARYKTDLSPEVRAICQAYANGLNHYAALHADKAFPGVFPVSGEDIVAGSVHKAPLFFGLDRVLGELYEEDRRHQVSERTQAGWPWSRARGAHTLGSNTFSVSPLRSANGETFLAVNSHQPWEGPVTWYEVHLHSEEGWDAAGALFPGMPVMVHGHNRDVGWAFTVNHPDLVDVYVLELNPDDPNQYRFDGQWLDLEQGEARIKVKLFGRLTWTVKQETLWSVYGPVVRQPHGTYAVRYAGHDNLGIYEQLYRLNRARNLQEWQAAMRRPGFTMFNAGYADREGNIYYLYNGLLPVRAEGYDWSEYLPGNTSETLWSEYLPFDELPQVLNPAAGFIQNCNSSPFQTTIGLENPKPEEFSVTLGIESEMNNRSLRALELFGGDDSITFDEFYAYKYDMAYTQEWWMGDYTRLLLEAPLPEVPEVQQALGVVRDWDLRVDPESRGAALVIWTYQSLGFPEPDEVDPEALADAFVKTVEAFLDSHGRVDVAWSEVNRLQRGNVDLGLGGGPDVLHAVSGEMQDDARLRGSAGDSFVMLVRWDGDGRVQSQSIHQYGTATLDETSSHFADQAPLFVNRQLKDVWLDEADIRAHLEREYVPGEEIAP